MKTIGIIGAMEVEVAILKEKMEDVRIIKKLPWIFMREYLLGKKVVVVRSGIGKVNAGICAQILADVFSVDAIINTGIAGSLNKNINIGDIVLSTDVVQHDMDATGLDTARDRFRKCLYFSLMQMIISADLLQKYVRK